MIHQLTRSGRLQTTADLGELLGGLVGTYQLGRLLSKLLGELLS